MLSCTRAACFTDTISLSLLVRIRKPISRTCWESRCDCKVVGTIAEYKDCEHEMVVLSGILRFTRYANGPMWRHVEMIVETLILRTGTSVATPRMKRTLNGALNDLDPECC